jgi:hypothetical protein
MTYAICRIKKDEILKHNDPKNMKDKLRDLSLTLTPD